ncbi:MAG: hypothetical protein KJ760_19930 [Proteobacteria bacterium]|nr:hypothetical protein [Pseudomonadota bacterium]
MTLIDELRKESTGLKGIIIIHLDFITQAINEGYTKRKIFNFLIKKNLLKTDYSYFVKVLNKVLIESNFKQEIILNEPESIRPKKFKMVDIKDSDFE